MYALKEAARAKVRRARNHSMILKMPLGDLNRAESGTESPPETGLPPEEAFWF
jgi:hypothetical protein